MEKSLDFASGAKDSFKSEREREKHKWKRKKLGVEKLGVEQKKNKTVLPVYPEKSSLPSSMG